MKKAILICSIFLISTILSGQKIRLSITPTSNVFHNSYEGKNPYDSPKLGLNTSFDYFFITRGKMEFGLGIDYQVNKVLWLYTASMSSYAQVEEKISLLSANFNAIYKLSEIFYLSIAPSVDFRLNRETQQSSNNQSGIGFSSGLGGNFKINNKLYFNVEPRLWVHNIVPFQHVDQPFKLSFAGINLGLVFGQ
jgi:hypothetical protein